jgi:hypothetical protein
MTPLLKAVAFVIRFSILLVKTAFYEANRESAD